MYDVLMGLYPYPWNGGRARVEIRGEFHEVAVPLSTLLALYRCRVVFCHLSVRCVAYLPISPFLVGQMRGISRETGCRRVFYAQGCS